MDYARLEEIPSVVRSLAGRDAVGLAKAKKSNGFHTWSEDEITKYKTRHPAGTKPRLALEILLQTRWRSRQDSNLQPAE